MQGEEQVPRCFSFGSHDWQNRKGFSPQVCIRMKIYVATGNAGSWRSLWLARGERDVEVLALPGLREMAEPVEDAATFMGNAELKAVAYSRLAAGLLVMADDSGLCVDALSGAPGVRSARFAEDAGWPRSSCEPTSQNRDVGHSHPRLLSLDERNNALLLERMCDTEDRRCAVCVCAGCGAGWRCGVAGGGEVRGD